MGVLSKVSLACAGSGVSALNFLESRQSALGVAHGAQHAKFFSLSKKRTSALRTKMQKRTGELPEETLEMARNATGLGPHTENTTTETAYEECEAAWLNCALNSGEGDAMPPALASRLVPREDALDPTKCPNVAALVSNGVFLEEDIPEFLSAEEYKMGCMCINDPNGCPPPAYQGPHDTCESAWGACFAMETDENLLIENEVSKKTGTTMCPGIMMGVEEGFIDVEMLPEVIKKPDYIAGCHAFLDMPHNDTGAAHLSEQAAALSVGTHDHDDYSAVADVFPSPTDSCYSMWDVCMWAMDHVEEFALHPAPGGAAPMGSHIPATAGSMDHPAAGSGPAAGSAAYSGSAPSMLQRMKKLATSKHLHRYITASVRRQDPAGSGPAAAGSDAGSTHDVPAAAGSHAGSAHDAPAAGSMAGSAHHHEPMSHGEPVMDAFHAPVIPFHEMSDFKEKPECAGVLGLLHEKALKMTDEELVRIPDGIDGNDFVEHVCLPALGADMSYDHGHMEVSETEHQCHDCHMQCGETITPKHEEIEETEACHDCHACHEAFFSGCESMMGTDDPQCHMQCNEKPACKQCTEAHENAWKAVAPEFDSCVHACDAGVCAADGTFDHEPSFYEPHDVRDSVDCHRSCDDEDCHFHCDDVYGIAHNQEMMDASHNPIMAAGAVLPAVGEERGHAAEREQESEVDAAVVPAPEGHAAAADMAAAGTTAAAGAA